MSAQATVPVTFTPAQSSAKTQPLAQEGSAGPSRYHNIQERRVSYGAVTEESGSLDRLLGAKGKDPELSYQDGEEEEYVEGYEDDLDPVIDVTWKYMSRLYLLVPLITVIFLILLILLVTFAWPPSEYERNAGPAYPQPLLWKPFIIGVFASCTVQTIRVPTWVVVSCFSFAPSTTTFLSTALHATIHELIRLSTLPLIISPTTSGFHSSYYLGLGWGAAEAAWGIVQGWDQLALYEDVMKPEAGDEERSSGKVETEDEIDGGEGLLDLVTIQEARDVDDEVDLERKVEILERMRARRDLEEVIGVPFPNIPFPLHLLWRLDTLLLNLGLTLILSAFYFDSDPIYRHESIDIPVISISHQPSLSAPETESSKYLGLVWALAALLHICVSLVWKVVGRVGVDAVTWGGLIVALGSVFAGLGCWGGLV